MASATTLNPEALSRSDDALSVPRGSSEEGPGVQEEAREAEVASLERFDSLYGQFHGRVFRFLMVQSRNPDLAETLTQETFLKAWNTRAQFRGDCSMNTWLMRIALNLLRDHTRTNRFRFWKKAAAESASEEDLLPQIPSRAGSQENHLIAQQQVELIWATVKELSERQRTVFHLRFVDELELTEIAEVMQLPLSTVKTHLYRALAAVRERHAQNAPAAAAPANKGSRR